MSDALQDWFPRVHQRLPLSALADFPDLAKLHALWLDKRQPRPGGLALPARLDPLDVPRALLPYVMLLDLEPGATPRLRVRLAGTYVCEKYGRDLKGGTTDDFFAPADAKVVVEAALEVARTGEPDLAQREYVTLNERIWRYTRLILPLSRDGRTIDGFFKALDPSTLANMSAASSPRPATLASTPGG